MDQPKKWTEKEEKLLIDAIKGGNNAAEIAKYLGRSEKSVRRHCEKLNIDVIALKQKKDVRSFSLVDVTCPHFKRMYRGKSIKCDGLTPQGYIIVGYDTQLQWMKHVTSFCNENYNKCPLYQLLEKMQKEREKRSKKNP